MILIGFGGLVVRGARARARGWERALGCPGAQLSIIRCIWDNLALPGIWDMAAVVQERARGCPGAFSGLSGTAT